MRWDPYEFEMLVAKFLRNGVAVAGALLFIGWISQLSFTVDTFAKFHEYHELRLVPALNGSMERNEWGLLISYFGLFVLISLPLLRVLMTLVVFLKNRDFILAAVSAVVLLGLIVSVTLGFEI